MSSVTDIRQRILDFAKEIEELSNSNIVPEKFFQEFLNRLAAAVGAPAGAVWMMNDGGRLELLCENGLADTTLASEPNAMSLNERLLLEVMGEGQARTYWQGASDVQLPTEHPLIIAPLRRAKQSVGAVQIFQRPDASEKARLGFLQFVEQMCGHACRYLDKYERLKAPAPAPARDAQFEQFVLNLHRSLLVQDVASTAAADGRLLIGCDRMGVAITRGRKTVLMAISGQDAVNRRAKLVRAIEKLIANVIATRKPLIYAGKLEELPPQIENPLADYIEETGARMVVVAPLIEPQPVIHDPEQEARIRAKAAPQKVIGGIIVEQFFESQPIPGLEENVDLFSRHISSAVFNARSHERLFLLPFRRLTGHIRSLFEGKLLMKTLAVLALLLIFAVALIVIPYDYRIEGTGQLMPVVQRSVFALVDGEVVDVLVDNGDRVSRGQKLLQLRNDDLTAELLAAKNELLTLQNELLSHRAALAAAMKNARQQEAISAEGEIRKTQDKIKGRQESIQILEEKAARLTVTAPIDGVVATFQLDRLLKNRPVKVGELLLEVMDDSDRWQLELEVEEHRMGHLLRGQERLATQELPLEFVLATNVESTFTGKLDLLSTRANKSDEGNVVEVFATIDNAELPPHQIGAEVEVKINCGKRKLGYVLFGDVVEFLQKHLWL